MSVTAGHFFEMFSLCAVLKWKVEVKSRRPLDGRCQNPSVVKRTNLICIRAFNSLLRVDTQRCPTVSCRHATLHHRVKNETNLLIDE